MVLFCTSRVFGISTVWCVKFKDLNKKVGRMKRLPKARQAALWGLGTASGDGLGSLKESTAIKATDPMRPDGRRGNGRSGGERL